MQRKMLKRGNEGRVVSTLEEKSKEQFKRKKEIGADASKGKITPRQ